VNGRSVRFVAKPQEFPTDECSSNGRVQHRNFTTPSPSVRKAITDTAPRLNPTTALFDSSAVCNPHNMSTVDHAINNHQSTG
jgi:hypothetical protein